MKMSASTLNDGMNGRKRGFVDVCCCFMEVVNDCARESFITKRDRGGKTRSHILNGVTIVLTQCLNK